MELFAAYQTFLPKSLLANTEHLEVKHSYDCRTIVMAYFTI